MFVQSGAEWCIWYLEEGSNNVGAGVNDPFQPLQVCDSVILAGAAG